MVYLLLFLEGIITFISPCLLPMLPIYLSYFAGQKESSTKETVLNSIFFILGFTLIFILLGAFASTIGYFLVNYRILFNIITGGIVIIFGLNYMGLLKIGLLNRTFKIKNKAINPSQHSYFRTFLFGLVFAIGWTPCVGAFLGTALLMASQQSSLITGILMLLTYSIGLGIPFIISAFLVNKIKGTFDWIKKHYQIITKISGAFLILIGLLMMTGLMGYFLSLLTF